MATTWNDVKQFIHDAIKAAVDLLDDGVNLFYYVFTVVTNALQVGLNAVTNVATIAWQWVEQAAVTVGGWIQFALVTIWNEVIWPAIQLVHGALDFAVGALQEALNLAAAGLSWLVDNIIMPVWHWIEHAAETVSGWIWAAIDGFYHDVILPIWQFVQDVGNIVGALWHWFTTDAAAAVEAVLRALGWIVWFGDHSFHEILDLLEGAGSAMGRDWVLANAKDTEGWSHKIADDLARILA